MEGKSFVAGMAAGAGILIAGTMLGGAGKTGADRYFGGVVEFDTIRARRVEVIRQTGDVAVQLRSGKDGGLLRVLDRFGDERAELNGDGSATFFCEGGRPLARVGSCINADRLGATDIPRGQLLVFDAYGSVVGKLPGWVEPTLRENDSDFAEAR